MNVFTEANFQEEVLNSDLPVIVDFYADWCPPCRMIAPVIEELEREYEGKIKVGKLNVDNSPSIAAKYGTINCCKIWDKQYSLYWIF